MTKLRLRTKLCDMFGIEYPIILAGMADVVKDSTIATGKLCAAVSNAGGLGVIGGGSMSLTRLREEIREAKRLTTNPFGVDLLFPAGSAVPGTVAEIKAQLPPQLISFVDSWYEQFEVPREKSPDVKILDEGFAKEQWEVVIDEGVNIIALGLGTPEWIIPAAHSRGMKVINLVGNVKQARRLCNLESDLIIAQGHEAGGHTGRIGLMSLLPQVVTAVYPTPVVAAGGIVHGSQLAAALTLGAIGVWMGTAFQVTIESPLTEVAKRALIDADEENPRISRIFTGKTARTLRNPFSEAWEKSGLSTLPMPYQNYLVRDFFCSVMEHKPELALVGAGQGVGMINKIKTTEQVITDLVEGAIEVLQKSLPANVTVG